jgi:hypothetical protein
MYGTSCAGSAPELMSRPSATSRRRYACACPPQQGMLHPDDGDCPEDLVPSRPSRVSRQPGPTALRPPRQRPAPRRAPPRASFLPPSVLGDRGAAFDDDLAASIGSFAADDGTFSQEVGFVYDLACKLPG